jgi:uncharacterized protein (DUF362 family)
MNYVTSFFMLIQSKSKKPEIVISKGNTPRESLLRGIEQLGGISKFIGEGDQVFIKFNLNLPSGFPTNTNFDLLESLIVSCKESGAKIIYLGSYPLNGIPIKCISDLLNLKNHFESLGAELAFLDNSNDFENKDINQDQLKKIKYDSLTKVKINNNEFLVPNIILNSNKFISINQVNVNPLFKLNLSVLNSYSIIPPKYQIIRKGLERKVSFTQDKKDLISHILDVFSIKQPNLVINDLYYILEGAGPYIYKDSKIKKTELMIIGDDAIAVDYITLNMLNLGINNSELLIQANNRDFGKIESSNIKVLGEKVEDNKTDIDLCVSELENIKLRNFSIKSGKMCTACFTQAYHLLNFMRTYMEKDLKYNTNNSFLIGLNPSEPEKMGNILLFGECAIKSTKNYSFKIIELKKESKKSSKLLKHSNSKKEPKIKKKPNKNILELPECPPGIFTSLNLILDYYGKKNLPNLNLFSNVNNFWINGKLNEKLKMWEAL